MAQHKRKASHRHSPESHSEGEVVGGFYLFGSQLSGAKGFYMFRLYATFNE